MYFTLQRARGRLARGRLYSEMSEMHAGEGDELFQPDFQAKWFSLFERDVKEDFELRFLTFETFGTPCTLRHIKMALVARCRNQERLTGLQMSGWVAR